jgi:DNA-binding SARP family transcriptional activator
VAVAQGLAAAGADPADVLAADEDAIALRPGVGVEVDAERFETLVRHRPPDVEAALALYDGDLAEGLGLECLLARREFLAHLYEDALASAARERLAAGDADGARAVAYLLLERDPLREDAHAVLMGAFAIIGSRSQVHRQYRHLRAPGGGAAAEPLAETSVAYRNALAGIEARSAARVRLAGASAALGRDLAIPAAGIDVALAPRGHVARTDGRHRRDRPGR